MSKIKLLKAVDKDGYTGSYYGKPFFWDDHGEVTCEAFLPNESCGHGFHAWIWEENLTPRGRGFSEADTFKVIEVEDSPENLVRLSPSLVKFKTGTILGSYTSVEEAVKAQGLQSKSNIAGFYGTATSRDYGFSVSGIFGKSTSGEHGTSISGDHGTSTSEYKGKSVSGSNGISISGDGGNSVSGDCGRSISGEYGKSSSGSFGWSISGIYGTSISGDSGKSISGNYGKSISGNYGFSICGGYGKLS